MGLLQRQTIFQSSADNNACALDFTEALKKLGHNPTPVLDNPDGSAHVLYAVTPEDFEPLVALMIEIERQHSEPGTTFAGDTSPTE